MNKRKITMATRQQLAEMFLPELHAAWWAERLAQLQDEQDAATDRLQVMAIEARISDHYKSQYDIEQTRARLVAIEEHDTTSHAEAVNRRRDGC